MGRRRVRDLTYLRPKQVAVFEPNTERCEQIQTQFGVDGHTMIEDALATDPKVMVISVPPALHEQYVQLAMSREMHVFSELPFVWSRDGMRKVVETSGDYPATLGISATLRYYPPFELIHSLIHDGRIGKPFYFELNLGHYLPHWHPNEDYRRFYASDARQGGAGLDMLPHELAAVQWWLGPIKSVVARLSKVSDLEINGPDCHDILLTFASGCRGYFHNDVLEMHTRGRRIHIVGSQGTLRWIQDEPFLRISTEKEKETRLEFSEAKSWQTAVDATQRVVEAGRGSIAACEFSYESNYLREMEHFLGAVEGKHAYTAATPAEELHTVSVVQTILETGQCQTEQPIEAGVCV